MRRSPEFTQLNPCEKTNALAGERPIIHTKFQKRRNTNMEKNLAKTYNPKDFEDRKEGKTAGKK